MGALHSAERRRHRRSSRSLQRLAQVELQLVLQFLDPTSRLRAARCSRALFAAADDEFAWSGGGCFHLSRLRDPPADLPARMHSSLLRHAPIALRVAVDGALPVAVLLSLRRLRELYVGPDLSDLELQLLLLSEAALCGVRVLRLPDLTDYAAESAIVSCVQMPQLQSLRLRCPPDHELLEPLLRLTSLRDLRLRSLELRCGSSGLTQQHLEAVGRMERLRSLRLADGALQGDALLARFCGSAAMRQLRHLRLDNDGAVLGPPPRAEGVDLGAAFSQLLRLESLGLRRIQPMARMLAAVQRAPALRLLVVECAPESPLHPADSSSHPRRADLQSLLDAAPALEMRLRMAPLDGWLLLAGRVERFSDVDFAAAGVSARWADEQWAALHRTAIDLLPRVALRRDSDDQEEQ